MNDISVFDLFSIGLGPSSSHTVGPMRAGYTFLESLQEKGLLSKVSKVQIHLYGSLALTGKGHKTDDAVMLGLSGQKPELADSQKAIEIVNNIRTTKCISLFNQFDIPFDDQNDIVFHYSRRLEYHANGMTFKAYTNKNKVLLKKTYFSIGGGFIIDEPLAKEQSKELDSATSSSIKSSLPFPFENGTQLFQICREHGLSVAEVIMRNEETWRSKQEIKEGLLNIWDVMKKCALRGMNTEGILPGGLNVRRRAPGMYRKLGKGAVPDRKELSFEEVMDWVGLWALSINEENAAGGRVVTAPTNGGSGTLPAVLHYYYYFNNRSSDDGVVEFLLVAGAIGILYKKGASISAAEVGCQGEIGVACSMAAGGLAAAMGGTNEQIENAAEIGMEHNLGLTCDPINGLVQIPCIERNVMGAMKAINATRLALRGDGQYKISLDKVIQTMKQTGKDMRSIYKETSKGGLAVNLPEC